jgi:hypothetical protein
VFQKFLRPQCRLSDARQTIGLFVGPCPLAAIRALTARMFKTRAFTDFVLFNHLIRAGAAVAGYADPEAADFPVKPAPGISV